MSMKASIRSSRSAALGLALLSSALLLGGCDNGGGGGGGGAPDSSTSAVTRAASTSSEDAEPSPINDGAFVFNDTSETSDPVAINR